MRWSIAWILGLSLVACASPRPVVYPDIYTEPPQSDIRTTGLMRNAPPQGPFQPNAYLFACRDGFSNQPPLGPDGRVLNFNPIIVAFGVVMAAAPANDVCMSSGFGIRGGRMHKGIDLVSRPAGTIYSAAPGVILEVSQQTGFGNQVVIDHGSGVYTRYAHFQSFAPALAPGQRVGFGEPIGTMGATGNATGVHLHFEVLTGNYNTPRKSWGLEAHNPLDFPAWQGLDGGS